MRTPPGSPTFEDAPVAKARVDLAAAPILVTVPALVVFYVVQKYVVSGLTAGGTKG
ncbi:MAG: hypothetical protein ACJ73E_03795 [Mycobacteriales bacterium]